MEMMKIMDDYQILQVVLALVSIVVTGILIPLIKTKITKDKLEKALVITDIAVKAAEQIYKETGQGAIKKKYVIDYLKKSGLNLRDEEINALIESAVKELNLWQTEILKE